MPNFAIIWLAWAASLAVFLAVSPLCVMLCGSLSTVGTGVSFTSWLSPSTRLISLNSLAHDVGHSHVNTGFLVPAFYRISG
jgi:hypothetical protein